MNWRLPESDDKKVRVLKAAWGDNPPDYCYYLIPDEVGIDETFSRTFFPNKPAGFGDIECARSNGNYNGLRYLGNIPGVQPFHALRIRNAQVQPPPFVMMGGVRCPLVQFGHGDDNDQPGLDGQTKRAFNFIKEWGWAA